MLLNVKAPTVKRVLNESSYEFVTSYEERFMEEIKNMESQIRWIHDMETKDLRLIPAVGPLYADQYAADYGLDTDIVYSTMDTDGSNLLLSERANNWCVGTTCFAALSDRAKLNGSALKRMPPSDFSDCLNFGFKWAKDGKTVGYEVFGKMASLHAESSYEIMPISELLQITQEAIKDDFGYGRFITGMNRVDMTACVWDLPDNQEVLVKAYEDALKESRIVSQFNIENLMPVIRFQTSNTSNSSAFIMPMFRLKGAYIRLLDPIGVRHEKSGVKSGLDKFEEESHGIWAKFHETAEKVGELASTMVIHGPNCVVSLCKNYGIPKKYGNIAFEQIDGFTGGGMMPISAHDIYLSLSCAIGEARNMKASLQTVNMLEESLARILSADWNEHDVAGSVSWGK